MEFNGQKSAPYLADILHQHGVEQVVICPGSRNAPLTLSFTRHGLFQCCSIIDERSAAYFALGMAKASGKPVVMVCTSGTAALNFAPAIAEAYYQQVPLMVITADRPQEWMDQQDGQAIHQNNIYAGFVAKSYSLKGELYHSDELWMTERIANEAVHIATIQSRPVHINISFKEPLYNEDYSRVKGRMVTMYNTESASVDWSVILKGKKNILLLLGQMDADQSCIDKLQSMAMNQSAVVVAENLSNALVNPVIHNLSELQCLFEEEMRPDLILYMGGPIVSKQSKKFVANLKVPLIRIQQHDDTVDTFQSNIGWVRQTPHAAIADLANYLKDHQSSPEFYKGWQTASEKAVDKRNAFVRDAAFSDLKVFEFLANHIPSHSILHLGNSTPVRYAQVFNNLFAVGCKFHSNRGTSGIDGSTSTAVGYSKMNKNLNFLIVGDLSFQYDANAFFNEQVSGNLKIIVLNNGGGNIFRIIEGPKRLEERESYFETRRQHEFSSLAKHFNLNYFSAKHEDELDSIWNTFIESDQRPSVLEIFTDAETSAKTFIQLYKYLQVK